MRLNQPGLEIGQPPPSKIATATWFLLRPYTYRHLVEMLRRQASPWLRDLEASGAEAQAWGDALAVAPRKAMEALLGPGPYEDVTTLYPDTFRRAEAGARESIGMGGAANLDLLYHLVRGLEARRVLETGVAYGWSSLSILLAQKTLGGGKLASTDMPYPRADNEEFVGCVVPEDLRGSWTLIRRPDRPGLGRAIRSLGQVDLAHYDSDKTYAGQSWAYPRIWKALRPGGVLVSDDIQYQTAFRDFAATSAASPIIVDSDGKLIGILRKPL